MTLSENLKQLDWYMWLQWRRYACDSGTVNLSNTEMEYLYALISAEKQGIRLTDLAKMLGITKASASVMVSKLEKQGYIYRQSDKEDARTVRLFPTAKAFAMQQEELEAYQQTAIMLTQALSDEELNQLNLLLDKSMQALWKTDITAQPAAKWC